MSIREIRGRDLKVGDAVEFLGRAHRVDSIDACPRLFVENGTLPEGTRVMVSEGRRFMTVCPDDVVRVYGEG